MHQPASNSAAYCINPDCQRPVVRSLASRICPTCKTTLRLNDRFIPLAQLSSNRYTATFLVYDLSAKTEAVLKVLIEPSPKAAEFFRHTAKVLSSMRCPGLPRVAVKNYFLVSLRGSVHSLPCFVMERISGKSFQAVIDEYPGGCPEGWVVGWLRQMLDALQFLHGRQLIHGNLTPDNIMLREETDQPALLGFGNPKQLPGIQIAPLGEARSQAQAYKPADQLAGIEIDPAADLFALGRICIQLLTGIYPLELEDEKTGKLRWRNRVRVSSGFADLLDKMTHPSPGYRPKTATEVKTALAEMTAKQERSPEKPQSKQVTPKRKATRKAPSPTPVTVMQDIRTAAIQIPSIADAFVMLLQVMMNVAFTSAIATAFGFWLIFYSPLRQFISQFFATLPPSIPAILSPPLLLFMSAGIGTIWGMMHFLKGDRPYHFWTATLLGSMGYGLSWVSWQWLGSERPVQAMARIAAIAALFLTVELCHKRHLLIHLLVAGFGTSLTMFSLVRSQVLRVDLLYALFPSSSAIPVIPDTSLLIASMMFFISLGVVACFWAAVSQIFLVPLLMGLFGKRG